MSSVIAGSLPLWRTRLFFTLPLYGPTASKATVLDESCHEENYYYSPVKPFTVHLQCLSQL